MIMNCQQVRDELALEVGQDLDREPGSELRDHLARCPACCRAWLQLQESQGYLEYLQMESPVVERPGLWCAVENQITRRGLRPRSRTFPGPLIGLTFGVLFLALVLRPDWSNTPSATTGEVLLVPVDDRFVSSPEGYSANWLPAGEAVSDHRERFEDRRRDWPRTSELPGRTFEVFSDDRRSDRSLSVKPVGWKGIRDNADF